MKIRHATLQDVVGRSANSHGFKIVPARLELDQWSRAFAHLNELQPDRIPPVLRVPIEKQFDVAWVRARLPCVFGFTPEPAEVEKTLLYQGFVAVPDGSMEGIPFECSDYYGKTSLTFSPNEDAEMKSLVANAFWSILLSEPESLVAFSTRVFHPGAGIWLNFGCKDGEPYCFESFD